MSLSKQRLVKRSFSAVRVLIILGFVYWCAATISAKLPGALLVNVSPWEAGVRQENFGSGLEARDLAAGSYVEWPGLSAIQIADMRGRVTVFGGEDRVKVGSLGTLDRRPALDIRTLGNQTAQVSLAIAWHIKPGTANQMVSGALLSSLSSKVAAKLEGSLQARLASLSSEQWFDARRRQELASGLRQQLGAEVAPFFVEIDGVYIEGVRFSSDYENKLQEKQVAHQLALLHDARGRVEEAHAKVATLNNGTDAMVAKRVAEWEQVRKSVQVAFDLEIAAMEADSDIYVKTRKAEVGVEYSALLANGAQAVKLAGQDMVRMKLEALDSEGGRIWLARMAADNLDVDEVWLNSADPRVPSMLDLDVLAGLLAGQPTPSD